MAPRVREHWPAQPTHSFRTRPTRSPRPLPPPKQPPPPPPLRTPLELFAAQQQLPSSGDSTQHPLSLSPDIQNEWDNLPPEDRQVWEAQYGRQVLERQKVLSSYYNGNCTKKVVPDGPDDHGSDIWSTDSDSERENPPYLVNKVARKPAASRVKKNVVIEASGSEAGSNPVRKPTSRVMYRTELYRVKKDMDGNLISSDCTKATRHEQPPKLKLTSAPTAETTSDSVDENLPIFEVTTFLAAPPAFDFKTWQFEAMAQRSAPWPDYDPYGVPPAIRTPRVGGYHPSASELARRRPRFDVESLTPDENDEIRDDESVVDPDKPIKTEGEAGTVLEIHSPLIINAIQKVGPGYPGLTVEGSSLTVTEPFCALMHYRDQMKGYYKASEVGSEPQSSKSTSHLDSKGALVKPESRAPDNQPPKTRQDGVTHVDELYQFLDHLYLKSVASERLRWAQEVPTCTFEWVWLLFPPQTLIYEPKSFDEPVSRAFRVKTFKLQGLFDESQRSHSPSVNPHRLKSRQDPHFKNHLEKVTIIASYLKHDGRKWMTQKKQFRIVPFKGEKKITDLPAYPARYLKDPGSTTRSRLIERGKRYHSLASRGQFEYHGETLSGSRRRLDGRILVDSETYHYDRALTRNTRDPIIPYHRSRELEVVREPNSDSDARSYVSISDTGSESDDGPFNVVKEIEIRSGRPAVRRSVRARPQIQAQLDAARKGEEEADELFMICHSELRAYVLKERDWVRLSVDSISPCSFDQQMIDDLQISPGAKRMIQAFSQGYSMSLGSALERRPTLTAEAWSADFVPGKGRGQIMLLHGRPGTGKTSTAECIAELTKRPLLTVTCGDLGTNSYLVEQELTRWLRLGALWNAVLLFDEADVFLESREHGDIERNGLVSVFLRALEYYQGLMFLTTNRIGTFDEAILSRVHVILHFPDLTDTERAKIWDTSFRKLADERPNIKIDFSLFDLAYRDEKIKNLKWNGREIRNAFNTMIALAEFDAHANGKVSRDGKVEVRREHLQEVADMSGGFKRYMRSLRGLDSAGYAKGLGLRDDEFDSKGDGEGKRE